ncbi:hypothetical protein [Pseudomonas sp. FW300-N2A2]|uniref:hypothetical protein n=1 Tax=Pseudomonas sp. FW300-N2A2 TaxID=2751316 RepID=UPI001A925CE6|nr:hypothetical protein [Pseudomonas sp. FW300-N2A2]
MKDIKTSLTAISKLYNTKKPHLLDSINLICTALEKLEALASYEYYGDFKGVPNIAYYAFTNSENISRPVQPEMFHYNRRVFLEEFNILMQSFQRTPDQWTHEEKKRANNVVYTGVMAIACCYDLWQRGSRKTPGTFFEIFMAGILKEVFAEYYFSKHIPLTEFLDGEELGNDAITEATNEDIEGDSEEPELKDSVSSLSTDLVIKNVSSGKSLVIPFKITTRERIVQPFAHQRILDSAFGIGKFSSFIVCISETQQDKKNTKVNQVCVPGTVKLYQQHLAPVRGLYYCDIPQRYDAPDMQKLLPVKTVGDFFVDAYHFFHESK